MASLKSAWNSVKTNCRLLLNYLRYSRPHRDLTASEQLMYNARRTAILGSGGLRSTGIAIQDELHNIRLGFSQASNSVTKRIKKELPGLRRELEEGLKGAKSGLDDVTREATQVVDRAALELRKLQEHIAARERIAASESKARHEIAQEEIRERQSIRHQKQGMVVEHAPKRQGEGRKIEPEARPRKGGLLAKSELLLASAQQASAKQKASAMGDVKSRVEKERSKEPAKASKPKTSMFDFLKSKPKNTGTKPTAHKSTAHKKGAKKS